MEVADRENARRVERLTASHTKIIAPETLVFTDKISKWCALPYPNHPSGCPNQGKGTCTIMKRDDLPAKYREFALIYAQFDFHQYLAERQVLHPDWSVGQLGNKRSWQGTIKRLLKERIKAYIWERFPAGFKRFKKFGKSNLFEIFGCGSGFRLYGVRISSMECVGMVVFRILKNNKIPFTTHPEKNTPRSKQIINMCAFVASNPPKPTRERDLKNWFAPKKLTEGHKDELLSPETEFIIPNQS